MKRWKDKIMVWRATYLEEMNLVEARTFFLIRTRIVKCKTNQSSDPYNRSTLWRCEDCGYVDTQSHIIHCPAYKDIWSGRSLNSDSDVVSYFSEVLKWRAANHWQVFVLSSISRSIALLAIIGLLLGRRFSNHTILDKETISCCICIIGRVRMLLTIMWRLPMMIISMNITWIKRL